ncbi:MAG: oxygen-independent coproporphyrinogen-3 oxidase [Halocynthiibacter sp.]|jgi:putative oxygen-independent coproporphyrinogen III oxidase
MTGSQQGGFGLYIHWPFCQAKCPYCDFNSHVVASIDQARWQATYIREIKRAAEETPGRILNSVFFGGGTPSMMAPELVASILETIRAAWPQSNDIEITLEANPTSVEAGRFQGYRDAGVNRISMGIQALNDPDLRALGRLHSVTEARAAFDIARSTFERVSFDLIYARQNQTLNAWRDELDEALLMAADHLSLYQLTIEEGTAFGDRAARGKLKGLPNEDLAADMYELTQELTGKAGLPAYEVSNHAKNGNESRHNLIYWQAGDYIGIGPGAHGRLTLDGRRHATETALAPTQWLKDAEAGNGENLRQEIDSEDQAVEMLMMGLRVNEGISLKALGALSDVDYSNKIKGLSEFGLIQIEQGRLRLTKSGRPVLNAILRELLA